MLPHVVLVVAGIYFCLDLLVLIYVPVYLVLLQVFCMGCVFLGEVAQICFITHVMYFQFSCVGKIALTINSSVLIFCPILSS